MIGLMSHDEPNTALLTIGHSPDADDAFMWWPLGDIETGREPSIDTGRFRFRAVARDIEELNQRAAGVGDLDLTAISAHNYAHVEDRYAITSSGASMGDGYGPKVVARPDRAASGLENLIESGGVIATPGERTTAFLALQLCARRTVAHRAMLFSEIVAAVQNGVVDAGLVIHEAQLTFADSGLELLVDLGDWWKRETGLPLPLGLNVIRRDLDERFGAGASRTVAGLLQTSIKHALRERAQSLDVAMEYSAGVAPAIADRFVSMYVNALTLDAGPEGAKAIEELLSRGANAGLCPQLDRPIELVLPE